jgi:hypothetical protein
MNRFKTAQGRLTPYAFMCGYVERRPLKGYADAQVTLWHEGGPLYQIRAHNHETGERLFWESVETLTEARRIYDRAESTHT